MRDWLSNGDTYMLLIECMAYDWPWVSALIVGCSSIIVLWFMVARRAWAAYIEARRNLALSDEQSEDNLTGLALALVFIGCAAAGYLPDIIGMFVPAYRIKVIALAFLVPVAIWLVLRMGRTNYVRRKF